MKSITARAMGSSNQYNKDPFYVKPKAAILTEKTIKERKTSNSKATLSIPLDMVIEILSWLPFKPLQRFKCVCKAWWHLLSSESYFTKLHCQRVMTGLTRHYDHQMNNYDQIRGYYHFDFLPREMGGGCFPVDGQDTPDEVHESYYGNCVTYSFRNYVRHLNASGFLQNPWEWQRKTVSFCNGFYIVYERCYFHCYLREYLALVLVPTRETGIHIGELLREWWYFPQTNVHVCVGGNSAREDQRILSGGVDVIVGTPSCVLDILERRVVRPDLIKTFLLYQADHIFSRGYKDEVFDIFKLLPKKVEVRVISQTIPREAIEIPRRFWNQTNGEWIRKTPSEVLEDRRKNHREEMMKRKDYNMKLVSQIDVGKSKKKAQRKKTSTLSWNPHLKRHR